MKKRILALTIIAALVLSLAACGQVPASERETPAAEPQVTPSETAEPQAAPSETAEPEAAPSETAEPEAAPSETAEPEAETGRQDGERFETVIILEGMEETVQYEHVINKAAGFEMDYDYESFVRRSGSDRECFISVWDDPDNPENYLEVTYSAEDADAVESSVSEALSLEYDLIRESRELDRAGSCVRIEASELKGTGRMADQLQAVYIIPAADGCIVAAAHYAIEAAEGFGRRFAYMLNTLALIDRSGEQRLSDEQALAAVKNYCYAGNPDLESIVSAGESPVYWELSSSGEQEIVVLFRSYTGSINRYYIDPVSGDTYVTEFVPGITDAEQRTEESFNAWDYLS